MAMSSQLTVNTTPVLLVAASGAGRGCIVENNGTGDIWIDDASNVSSTTGFRVPTGAMVPVDLPPGSGLYAVATAAQSVHVLLNRP